MSLCEEGYIYECPLCGEKARLENFHDPESGEAAGQDESDDMDDDPPTMCFSCGGIFGFYQLIEHPA